MLTRDKMRKFAVAGTTFSVALGIGFVMQNGDALAARFSDAPTAPVPPAAEAPPLVQAAVVIAPEAPVVATPEPTAARPAIIDAVPTMPAEPWAPALAVALESEPEVVAPPEPAIAALPDCPIALTATTLPAAMVRLDLSAPCLPDQMARIHHQGMMFTILTAPDGTASVTVPALVEGAVFVVDLGEGEGAVAVAEVPDLALVDRAVLQWQDTDGLGIHALEFGAGYGSDGHVWAGHPRAADAAMLGQGGFLILLGDPTLQGAMLAEVYTYPTGMTSREGQVALSVEAVVTTANCGLEIAAQSIQIAAGAETVAADLTMSMPGCDAVGEILVLSNMLTDLTLAAR